MNKKLDIKKYITATNILIIILLIFYFLDRFLPFPEGYTGYNAWDNECSAIENYIFGYCGGLLSNYMAVGKGLGVNGLEPYRQFTSTFLHGHILHLIANLVALYYIGNYTEKRFSWWLTYLVFFLVAFVQGFITDALYFAMAPDKIEESLSTISTGASGGIYGIMGLSLAAIFFDIKSIKEMDKTAIIVLAGYGFLTTYWISFGWTTICHNVSLLLGLALGTLIILPFFILKKGKFAPENKNLEEGSKNTIKT